MQLASLSFLLYLASVSAASFLVPPRLRWVLLLATSYAFYWLLAPWHTLLLALVTVVSFAAARGIAAWREQEARANRLLVGSVVVLLLPLLVLKYTDFVIQSVLHGVTALGAEISAQPIGFMLPVGISFFTFHVVGYVIDVHREMAEPEQHLGRYAACVAFFPHITAGPIARTELLEQFKRPPGFDYDRVTTGIKIAAWGVFKKVAIADRLAVAVDGVYASPSTYSGSAVSLVVVLYVFQVYADFSGYTDIAIGSAKVIGMDLQPNFARPYLSRSVGEYWRRWHLSFSTWLRDYVYMPIGAALRSWGTPGAVAAIFLTFLIAGLWHGAAWTFCAFGAAHGLMLVIEHVTKRRRAGMEKRWPRIMSATTWLVTFLFLCFVDVLFRAPSLEVAGAVYHQVGTGLLRDAEFLSEQPASLNSIKTLFVGLGLSSTEFVLSLLGVAVLVVVDLLQERRAMLERFKTWPTWGRWLVYYAAAIGILFFGSFNRTTSFVYYQF